MNKIKIPYGHQSISEDDIIAVQKVLKSDFLTQGLEVPNFESKFSKYTGASNSVAVSNGTVALHLACLAAELGEGDWLWTSPISFVASANVGLYCGANIDFVDIDPATRNIDIDRLSEKLKLAKKENKLPKVLIPVHFSGLSCHMEEIRNLSSEYNFLVIEDACHALGGDYKDTKIGSSAYSDMTVFSFHPVKSITTGEGGMITTNSSSISRKLNLLRTHGITRDPKHMKKSEPDGPWYYEQISLGYNYRLTDIQAALGSSQLKRIDTFIKKRNSIAEKYNSILKGLPIELPKVEKNYYSAFHLYVVRLHLDQIQNSHEKVFEHMLEKGVGVNLHYIPIHLQPYYKNIGFKYGDFPCAEKYYAEAVSIPIFQDMQDNDIEYVAECLEDSLG